MPRKKPVAVTHLPILRITTQRGNNDCGVAAIATITGKRYEDVLLAAGKNIMDTGMTVQEILTTLEKLGMPFKWTKRIRLDEDWGILGVSTPKRTSPEHVCVLYDGHIYDTDGSVWEADDFLAAEGGKAMSLLKPRGRTDR